jgi:hypothetical protein
MTKKFHCVGNSGVNHYQIWDAELDDAGNIVRDGAGNPKLKRLVKEWEHHNAVSATMTYYESYYLAYATSVKPVNRIKFTYATGSGYATTTLTASTAYVSTWQASWTNTTGASVTITTIGLVNYNGVTSDVTFATDSPNQVIAANQVMVVNWVHTWTKNGSDEGLGNTALAHIQDCFEGVETTSFPLSYFTVTSASPSYALTVTPTIIAGGSLTTAYTTWRGAATCAHTADCTITKVEASYIDVNGNAAEMFEKSGLSVDWDVGDTVDVQLTITWAIT